MNLLTVFVAALVSTGTAYAGTDMAPGTPDSKDMKGMSQMAPRSDAGIYVAAYGGAQWSTSYGNNLQTSTSPIFGSDATTTTIHSFWGGVGGIKVGYNFDSWAVTDWMGLRWQPAVEADALYIGDDSHASDLAGPGSFEHFTSNSGDFFLNGILRLPNRTKITPYFGVGGGLQYITTHTTLSVPAAGITATGLDTSDLDFAGQALAGFDFQLAPHFSLFTEYKFIDALGTDAKSGNLPGAVGGGTYRFKPDQIQQHLITAGIKYSF